MLGYSNSNRRSALPASRDRVAANGVIDDFNELLKAVFFGQMLHGVRSTPSTGSREFAATQRPELKHLADHRVQVLWRQHPAALRLPD